MRRLLPLFLILLCMACHNEADTYTSQSARAAAERYYAALMAGDYETFVDAMERDSMPADYRQENIDMVAQYADLMGYKGGMLAVNSTRDSLYADSLAYVFLDITFGDSTHEEILVPLVLQDKKWRMK